MNIQRHAAYYSCFLCLLLVSGCANLIDFEEPKVELIGIEALPSDGIEPRFQVSLRVINPNNSDMTIDGVYYELSLRGKEFITGASSTSTTVPSYGENTLNLQASIGLMKMLALMGDFIRNPDNPKLDYQFRAKIDVRELMIPLHITKQGDISAELLQRR